MKKYQDIKVPDKDLKNQFIQYFIAGQYNEAFALINNKPQLDSKIFVADVMNIIYNILITLENYYIVNVPNFLYLKLSEYNTLINNFLMRNEWNPSTEYQRYHFVFYNQQIYMYNNINPSSGNLPTDTNYWIYLGLKGDKGSPSIGTNLKYQWIVNTNYIAKDVVAYGEALYVALRNNINKNPLESPLDWQVLFYIPKAKITVSRSEPLNKYEGMIWWKIL